MKIADRRYRPLVQILVCNNRRPEDATLPCCANSGGQNLINALRLELAERGVQRTVWITQTGCLTFCSRLGATVAVWPKGEFYSEVQVEDVPSLVEVMLKNHG